MKTLDLKRAGTQSLEFQYPFVLIPLNCPTRKTVGLKAVSLAAVASSCSQTHFDSLYPDPTAEDASTNFSGMGPSLV